MKLVLDERLKYRLTGVAVIVAILAILLPAMMKKSTNRLEEALNTSLALPPKPTLPQVSIPTKTVVFNTVKVASITLPVLPNKPIEKPITKAQALRLEPVTTTLVTAPSLAAKKQVVASVSARASVKVWAPGAVFDSNSVYAVQLASFAQQENAEALVNRLRVKGYVASYSKFNSNQGLMYKVTVGQVRQKEQAMVLQKKLAQYTQLNGFIIKGRT